MVTLPLFIYGRDMFQDPKWIPELTHTSEPFHLRVCTPFSTGRRHFEASLWHMPIACITAVSPLFSKIRVTRNTGDPGTVTSRR